MNFKEKKRKTKQSKGVSKRFNSGLSTITFTLFLFFEREKEKSLTASIIEGFSNL